MQRQPPCAVQLADSGPKHHGRLSRFLHETRYKNILQVWRERSFAARSIPQRDANLRVVDPQKWKSTWLHLALRCQNRQTRPGRAARVPLESNTCLEKKSRRCWELRFGQAWAVGGDNWRFVLTRGQMEPTSRATGYYDRHFLQQKS